MRSKEEIEREEEIKNEWKRKRDDEGFGAVVGVIFLVIMVSAFIRACF